ncbi:unnamed protein product, partial [Ceratitis capitata]
MKSLKQPRAHCFLPHIEVDNNITSTDFFMSRADNDRRRTTVYQQHHHHHHYHPIDRPHLKVNGLAAAKSQNRRVVIKYLRAYDTTGALVQRTCRSVIVSNRQLSTVTDPSILDCHAFG